MRFGRSSAGVLALTAIACAHAAPRPEVQAPPSVQAPLEVHREQGLASVYANNLAGRLTASGEPYDPQALTAAHKTLPLGTRVQVISLSNGRSVWVRINDRGPYVRGRIIDLSRAAASQLGLEGLMRVELRLRDPAAQPSS
jgi:rare lipoprotein A